MVRVVLAALVLVFVVLVFMAASSCGGAGNRATWYAQVTAPPRLAWILLVLLGRQPPWSPEAEARNTGGAGSSFGTFPIAQPGTEPRPTIMLTGKFRLRWQGGCASGRETKVR